MASKSATSDEKPNPFNSEHIAYVTAYMKALPHSFYTQCYKGHYIHSHCQGGKEFVRWQFLRPGLEPIINNARSVKAAKAAITKMMRSYNGKAQTV